MDQKAWLYALAASGLLANTVQRSDEADAAPQKTKKTVECFGINTCKGLNSCGVNLQQLNLANIAYKERYKATKLGECAGTAEGSDKEGHLGWVKKDNKQDCFAVGGFVFLKEKDGLLEIEDKNGVRPETLKKK